MRKRELKRDETGAVRLTARCRFNEDETLERFQQYF